MPTDQDPQARIDPVALLERVRAWAKELGFSQIGVAGVDLSSAEAGLSQWLAQGFHGSMDYMAAHGLKRVEFERLQRPQEGVVSVYARGRDYHKVMRARLQKLQARMAAELGPFGHRVFTDSAPVLEAELAARSGQGWRGKHTLVLSRDAGSMFFLGEIYVDIALPPSEPVTHHCGTCTACMDACPTGAIVAPHRLDARRCISYLTIELHGAIPEDMRPLIGNRIYGCDDCQRVCPWNKYAHVSALPDFDEREGLTDAPLTALLAWSEEEFLRRTEGSPIRRIGHARWLRNVAVALGNALARLPADDPARAPLLAALAARREHPDEMVREHVAWAMEQKA